MLSLTPLPIVRAEGVRPVGPYLVMTTAPVGYPVTLDEAKAHLRVTDTSEDIVIEAMLQAACDTIENETRRALMAQQWEMHLDQFPTAVSWGVPYIDLPFPPCRTVDTIAWRDSSGAYVTVDPATYRVALPGGPKAMPARIWPPNTLYWPQLYSGEMDSVKVTFTAGYLDEPAAPDQVFPPALRAAILLMLADLYCNREATMAVNVKPSPTVEALLGPYRVFVV
jgi:uncharacterized phiE125 gp8 family phage protein